MDFAPSRLWLVTREGCSAALGSSGMSMGASRSTCSERPMQLHTRAVSHAAWYPMQHGADRLVPKRPMQLHARASGLCSLGRGRVQPRSIQALTSVAHTRRCADQCDELTKHTAGHEAVSAPVEYLQQRLGRHAGLVPRGNRQAAVAEQLLQPLSPYPESAATRPATRPDFAVRRPARQADRQTLRCRRARRGGAHRAVNFME